MDISKLTAQQDRINSDMLDDMVRRASTAYMQRVESELLRHDEFITTSGGLTEHTIVYRVLRWRDAPRRRARIAWLRFRRLRLHR